MVDTLKEVGRLVVLAVVAYAIIVGAEYFGLTVENKEVVVGAITAALKAVDRGVHESDKVTAKGLLPF